MKFRNIRGIVVIVAFFCLAATVAAAPTWMNVQVRNGQVRANPSFLGKIVATLGYGDRVQVLEQKGPWARIQVESQAVQGWMHTTSLTAKSIILKAGAEAVQQSATTDELALAGKGFTEQVESEFRSKNPEMNFAWVDKMETFVVDTAEMASFIEDGALQSPGGAP